VTIQISNAERLAMDALAAGLQPPPAVDYLAWAEANIIFTARESPRPGPYSRKTFPYFDEVLAAFGPADPCQTVTLMTSAQVGKTTAANIFCLGSLALDPGDFLFVHPNEDNAKRWSKMKLSPMLRATTSLTALFPQKQRDGSDSVLYKERIDGRGALQISGANSPAGLSQVTMKRQVQDDLAKWELNAAGDPEAQADSRSQAHDFRKVAKLSTPLVVPGCRITRSFEAGSQEYPEVPCPHCETFQVLEWTNMAAVLDESRPETAHFTCTACGCEIREYDRPWMLARLRWVARNPSAKRVHRSFWIWGAYSLLQSWEGIARRWISAKGDPASEQVFTNDVLGLAWRAQGEAVPWESLRDRASESTYPRGRIPAGALLITIGIDCQGDRVEWQVVGWGEHYRRWIIEIGVFPGHISEATCQDALQGLMLQTWPNGSGQRLAADGVAIDGNAWTEDVWTWVRRHPANRLMMVRGVPSESAPLLARVKKERSKDGKLLKYSRRFYNFGTSVLKLALYRNLAKTDALAAGYIGLPKGLEDEFFRQLTAERRVGVKRRDGFTAYSWVKDAAQANEGLDTHLQAEAAAIRLGVRSMTDAQWARLAAEREVPPTAAQGDLEDLLASRTAFASPAAPAAQGAAPAVGGPIGAAPPGASAPRPRTRLAM
jgi:phage terminase large subunit GpA-like protein